MSVGLVFRTCFVTIGCESSGGGGGGDKRQVQVTLFTPVSRQGGSEAFRSPAYDPTYLPWTSSVTGFASNCLHGYKKPTSRCESSICGESDNRGWKDSIYGIRLRPDLQTDDKIHAFITAAATQWVASTSGVVLGDLVGS